MKWKCVSMLSRSVSPLTHKVETRPPSLSLSQIVNCVGDGVHSYIHSEGEGQSREERAFGRIFKWSALFREIGG